MKIIGKIRYPSFDNTMKIEPIGCEAGLSVYNSLNNGIEPNKSDIDLYLKWKTQFVSMVSSIACGMKLKDAISHEIDECQYITGGHYKPEDLFDKKTGEQWIFALLGVDPVSSFANRIREMSQPRLIHTITTYLLGCHIQENLLLSFDTLPRIFSTRTKSSAFTFFWSIACLCHDLGYMYENEEKYKNRRTEMLSANGRKTLLNITTDFLSLDRTFLDGLELSDDEFEWVEKSIDLVKRYNTFRVECKNGYHEKIDHGIAGALILFDYMMSIAEVTKRSADPKPIHRIINKTAMALPEYGHANANKGHSRFRACCLIIALTVARHNVWTTKKGNEDERDYIDFCLSDQIISSKSQLISMSEPLNQLLFMLDFMDTIDPIKAIYIRIAEGNATFSSEDLELYKDYLLNSISIRCVHRNTDWHSIDLQFSKSDDIDDKLIERFICSSSNLPNWLNTEGPISFSNSIISFSFPVIKRTRKPYFPGVRDEEILDLCLYEGCCDSVRPGLFYQLPNAYQTFNLLMMDGLTGENIRIGIEKQSPNGIYIYNWRRTIKVFKNVFTLMCKYYLTLNETPDIEFYRADRQINTDMMFMHGRTIAFTSTSTAAFLEEFARGKKNLVYVKCGLSRKIPIADFEAILGYDYVYSDEAEILLPPWLAISEKCDTGKKKHPYEEKEMIATYSVIFGDMSFGNCSDTKVSLIKILDDNCEETAKQLDEFRMNPHIAKAATEKDYPKYVEWKNAFRNLVNIELNEIWERYNQNI